MRRLELSDALDRMAEEDAESADLVKLRLFAGPTVDEAGEVLGMSRTAAYRNWDLARTWLAAWAQELTGLLAVCSYAAQERHSRDSARNLP